jgi:hypothetical protein
MMDRGVSRSAESPPPPPIRNECSRAAADAAKFLKISKPPPLAYLEFLKIFHVFFS